MATGALLHRLGSVVPWASPQFDGVAKGFLVPLTSARGLRALSSAYFKLRNHFADFPSLNPSRGRAPCSALALGRVVSCVLQRAASRRGPTISQAGRQLVGPPTHHHLVCELHPVGTRKRARYRTWLPIICTRRVVTIPRAVSPGAQAPFGTSAVPPRVTRLPGNWMVLPRPGAVTTSKQCSLRAVVD